MFGMDLYLYDREGHIIHVVHKTKKTVAVSYEGSRQQHEQMVFIQTHLTGISTVMREYRKILQIRSFPKTLTHSNA